MFRLFYLYIIVITSEQTYVRKKGTCEPMNKKEELIERINNLSPEQFELLISLYSLQEQESVQAVPVGNPSFFQHAV